MILCRFIITNMSAYDGKLWGCSAAISGTAIIERFYELINIMSRLYVIITRIDYFRQYYNIVVKSRNNNPQ